MRILSFCIGNLTENNINYRDDHESLIQLLQNVFRGSFFTIIFFFFIFALVY